MKYFYIYATIMLASIVTFTLWYFWPFLLSLSAWVGIGFIYAFSAAVTTLFFYHIANASEARYFKIMRWTKQQIQDYKDDLWAAAKYSTFKR